jgi:hypothetical protein
LPGNGFAVFFDAEMYCKNGGEDEKFYSWTCEDDSRIFCHTALGMKFGRVSGPCWHMDHVRGINSSAANPYFQARLQRLAALKQMTPQQLCHEFEPTRIDRAAKEI